ncbi:MAG: ABC transporter ATP-binding protein [Phycisphaerales bacterium JB059]
MASVTLEHVNTRYPDGYHAVRDLSLEIEDGEFVVLVGPSGCGKSTTIRMIAGLESISEGTMRIGDRVVNRVSPKDRDIAMVFQNYALYPHMTVRQNLGFALRLRGLRRGELAARVNEVAEMLGLTEMLDRRPGQLSGGQRQRVALGRAIVREPAVYLFDEPLSNLDAKLRAVMRSELKLLHQRLGTTTIYVTHDQEEAMTLGDRIVVMSDGVVQQVGTPLEVYQRPVSPFVATFIGLPRMNLFQGEARREGDRWVFREASAAHATGQPLEFPLRATESFSDREKIIVGVRPQRFRVISGGEASPGDGAAFRATVRSVEVLGDEMDLLFDTGSCVGAIARVRYNPAVRVNEQVTLGADPSDLCVFPSEDEAPAPAKRA